MLAQLSETPTTVDPPARYRAHLVVQLGPANSATPVAEPDEVESSIASAANVRGSRRIHRYTRSSSMSRIHGQVANRSAGSSLDPVPRAFLRRGCGLHARRAPLGRTGGFSTKCSTKFSTERPFTDRLFERRADGGHGGPRRYASRLRTR
jgi:hypothetical protein